MMLFRHKALLGIVFLFALVFGAGSLYAQDDEGVIHVGMVIQGADGEPQTFCVSLAAEQATGYTALLATGLDVVDEHGPMGSTVCRIANTGCEFPADDCFCQCMGGDSCMYWSYFHLNPAGNWQYSIQGSIAYPLSQGDVEGWWWRDNTNTEATLPVFSFDDICDTSAQFPRVVVDGLGRKVVVEAPPQRIASVTLASDEILYDLVGPGRLLGVSHFANDPEISNIAGQLEDIPRTDLIGNPELLIGLDADLVVVTTYNNPAALDQLLDADVPIFVLESFNTLADVRENIRLLGRATGTEPRAEMLIEQMDATLQEVRERVSDFDPVRVLYYEPGGISYGPGSTVDEIITLAGGINVISEADLGAYPLVNPEFVLAADPDVILLGGWFAGETDPLTWFTHDPVFKSLRAVQSGRVYAISDAHLTTVSHYLVSGVKDVARLLYPEAFDEPLD